MQYDSSALLHLLQLASSALPVGAFSYSEGLETLVQTGQTTDISSLKHWLEQELDCGAVRVEASILAQAYQCAQVNDLAGLQTWNEWLSAFRESEELRSQSWQMGRSLVRLMLVLEPALDRQMQACGDPCNFVIAFAIAAAHWQINLKATILSYVHSWATNLVNAGIKLIPLGQTQGQQLLISLYPAIEKLVAEGMNGSGVNLYACGWGLAIASMSHETLYSRLFRS
jgi:urease accessory protein